MQNIEKALRDFAARYEGIGLLSTGARVVPYEGVLYNIEGSSRDPKINGVYWKKLLIRNGIDRGCYVTDPLPSRNGTSHPGFNVGGHMTPNSNGRVPKGGICYLMPLCKWHNSTRRNRTPFEHEETEMLELSGYMLGDTPATFAARTPGDALYRLVSVEGDDLSTRAFNEPPVRLFSTEPALPANYLIFRQVEEEGVIRFVIEESHFQDP